MRPHSHVTDFSRARVAGTLVAAALNTTQGEGLPFKRLAACKGTYGIAPLVNYYRGFRAICRKSKMVTTLRQYQGVEFHTIAPESFLFYPTKPELSEKALFVEAYERNTAAGTSNVWILKPSDGGKGNGILVKDDLQDILGWVEQQEEGSISWVVQKYLQNPLLIEGGRKFDVRSWVVLGPDYR